MFIRLVFGIIAANGKSGATQEGVPKGETTAFITWVSW